MQHGNANEGIATHSPVLWLSRNAAEQKPVPAAPPCSPSSTYGDEDDDKSFHKKRNKNYALRASAMATTGASLIDVKAEFAPRPTSTTLLRQSALQADSEHGKRITTMENADVDAIITALAAVIRAYTQEADKKKKFVPSACFDEQEHPLDSSSCWKQVPCVALVESFLRTVVIALELDESSLVIGLILIERAVCAASSPLVVCARTWRPTLLIAIVVASKIIYDEKVFLADYRNQLPHYNLTYATEQERAFLLQIGYNTTVRRGQYAKYYYALEDVSRNEWAG